MANYNKVILVGRLTRDPELSYTSGGNAIGKFSLAVNERRKDQNGEWQENAHFFDIVCWGRTAENCCEYLRKGRSALVDGRLQQDRWEDRETGQKRSKVVVNAFTVQFLDGRDGGGGGGYRSGEGSQQRGGGQSRQPAGQSAPAYQGYGQAQVHERGAPAPGPVAAPGSMPGPGAGAAPQSGMGTGFDGEDTPF